MARAPSGCQQADISGGNHWSPPPSMVRFPQTRPAALACPRRCAAGGAGGRGRAACEQAGVILMEGFMWRHHPHRARVKELLAAGEIGEPAFVRATHAFAMDDARRGRPDVRVQASLDGGSFMDVGCYALD